MTILKEICSKLKRNSFLFIAIAFLIMGLFFFKLGFDRKNYNLPPIYTYNIQRKADYKILLKDNQFYQNKVLPSGGYYVSSAIDLYQLNFKYNFKINKKFDISYRYDITTTLVGTYENSNAQKVEIWNYDFLNKERKDNIVLNNNFTIDEQININYDYYQSFVKAFEKNYGLIIDAILKVNLNVYYTTSEPNFKTKKDSIEVDIPITETITEVTNNYQDKTDENIFNSSQKDKSISILNGIGCCLVFTGIGIFIYKKHCRKRTSSEIYQHNLNSILHNYSNLIVTIKNKPNLEGLKPMILTNIDDLIDVAEQNNTNIIHYEIIKNEMSNLYVINNNYVYIFTIKN